MLGVDSHFLYNSRKYFTIIMEKPYIFGDVYSFYLIVTISSIDMISRALPNDMKGILCG